MIGRRYWIWIWWGIMALGVIGLLSAIYWGLQTSWRNLDEVLRGVGTILVSVGMLLLLSHTSPGIATPLLLAALISFILAFALGRENEHPPDHEHDEGPEHPHGHPPADPPVSPS